MRVVTLCNKLSRSRGSLGTPPPVRKEDVLSNMKAGEPASEVREKMRTETFASARLLHTCHIPTQSCKKPENAFALKQEISSSCFLNQHQLVMAVERFPGAGRKAGRQAESSKLCTVISPPRPSAMPPPELTVPACLA